MAITVRREEWNSALRPGRLRWRTDGDRMVLITCQDLTAVEALAGGEILRGPPRHQDPRRDRQVIAAAQGDAAPLGDDVDRTFYEAYSWLHDAMTHRLGGHAPAAGHWPIWAWSKITKRDLVAALRFAADAPRDAVMLIVAVSPDLVLRTKFSEWRSALDRTPLWPLDASDAEFEAWLEDDRHDLEDVVPGWRSAPWTDALRSLVYPTWDQLVVTRDGPLPYATQATIAQIEPADVVDAVNLLPSSRPPPR